MIQRTDKVLSQEFVKRSNKVGCNPNCHGVLVLRKVGTYQIVSEQQIFPYVTIPTKQVVWQLWIAEACAERLKVVGSGSLEAVVNDDLLY